MAYSISHHERLSPKKQSLFSKKPFKGKKRNRKGNTKVTKDDLNYMNWLHLNKFRFNCVVCESSNVEFHHVKRDSTDKKNHKRLIPLCQNHHTLSAELSAHGTPKKWREIYPMEFQCILADKIYSNYKESML